MYLRYRDAWNTSRYSHISPPLLGQVYSPRPYSAVSSYFAFAQIRILNLPNRILVLPIRLYVLFLDVNLTTNSWKVWKYNVNIEYQTEENRVMTTETGFLELKI